MEKLTGMKDTNLLILDKLDDRDLLSYCRTNKYAKELCNNEDFWRNRFIKVYGIEDAKLKDPNRSWKDYYLVVVYYKNRYTDKKTLVKVAEKGYMDLFNLFSKGMKEYDIKYAIVHSGIKELIYTLIKINDTPAHLIDVGLTVAAKKGDMELIEFYLSQGAHKSGIIIGALEGNQIDLYEKFKHTEDVGIDRRLRFAAYGGNKQFIDLFLKKGATDINGALNFAALAGRKDMVEYLISKGANNWDLGLEGAAEGGYIDLIDFFLSKGAKITFYVEKSAEISGDKDVIKYINDLKYEPGLPSDKSTKCMIQ